MKKPLLHHSAEHGFSAEADAYARGRPEYPNELLDWLQNSMHLQAGKTCIDLGAGTGKFTKLLIKTGANVLAIEPVEAMRTQLRAHLPDIQTIEGTAQSIPLNNHVADTVICAQAFHWFANEEALIEIHRVLAPSGRLGLIWNVRDESVDWVAAITKIITPYEAGTPRFHTGQWKLPFNGHLFSNLEERSFSYHHIGTPQEVIVDRFLSVSFIASLPEPEKKKVETQLRTLISSHHELQGKEQISFPYQTHAYSCSRL
nr:class I SAM-dependent methyltransferase [uncultured Deefgea sp.]